MNYAKVLLLVAACLLGAASLLNAENASDVDRSLHVKFSEPIIEVPQGVQSGGTELIKMKDHKLGKLLLNFSIEKIRYAYPPEYRIAVALDLRGRGLDHPRFSRLKSYPLRSLVSGHTPAFAGSRPDTTFRGLPTLV